MARTRSASDVGRAEHHPKTKPTHEHTAGTLALLAALGGTAVAYLDTAAFFGSEMLRRMSEIPTQDLLFTLIGLPILAALGGWLFAGSEPARVARTRTG